MNKKIEQKTTGCSAKMISNAKTQQRGIRLQFAKQIAKPYSATFDYMWRVRLPFVHLGHPKTLSLQ